MRIKRVRIRNEVHAYEYVESASFKYRPAKRAARRKLTNQLPKMILK